MIRVACGLALAGSVLLAACSKDEQSTLYDAPKPLDRMSTEEWCGYYQKFLSNPQLTAKDRAIDIQRMKQRGCPNVS